MTLAPDALYLNDPECPVSIVDLPEPGAAQMRSQERALWPRHTEVEILNEVDAAVIRQPGWVSEPAA